MELNSTETPLPLRIKDTLSAIFGQMLLQSLGRCAQVSKFWKSATDYFIILDKLNLGSDYEYASAALKKFQHAKRIKLPRFLFKYKEGEEGEHVFYTEIYPKGVKSLTALSLPPKMDYVATTETAREDLAHLILDPLPKSCVHFDYVSFWPEVFNIMDKNHSKNLKSLSILLNTGGKVSGPWDSLYSLIKNSTQLESLGLNYFDSTRFVGGPPNFNLLSNNLTHVLGLATQLQHLNIPHYFNVDSIVQDMGPMPHLTYLYIQSSMTKTPPNMLLEKCSKLQFLHLQLENATELYHLSSTSLKTLLIDPSIDLNSITIECPNLEVLKFTRSRSINEISIVGEHKIQEFTSQALIRNGRFGNFTSLKIADQNVLVLGNSHEVGLMENLEHLTLECEAPRTQVVYDVITKLSQFVNLKSLELINVKRLEALDTSIFSRLTKLVLKKCEINSKEMKFENLVNLKDLQMLDSQEISTIEITGCHQLSNLVLFNHANLRILEIKDSPNIESVDVRNCALNLSSWRIIENLPKMVNLLSSVIPMSSYLKITEQLPMITISGKKVMDRVYQGSVSMINTPFEWKSKEEYDESGPNMIITRKCF